LRHLDERSARRNANLTYLSQGLEALHFDTLLPPADIERVYYEYHIRYPEDRWGLPQELLLKALQAEGCHLPPQRYELLHQQPFFTEGHAIRVARCGGLGKGAMPVYRVDDLPKTIAAKRHLIRLPVFPRAEQPLLDQYMLAFQKVLGYAQEIIAAGID
jgi:dTDP-4-amino-4,6-dideoxygalactose transaminase